ncbi:MAG: flagellar biosynthesis protein [Candidatus Accumulibacter sp.]|nr:flagellar biosynthesis protein [Accumulibacter sp.]
MPVTRATPQTPGKEVLIVSVADRRVFEVAPESPSIPSLDPKELQSSAVKSRAVGRKRNTYGKALGDILLKEGRTVETLVAESIRQAFAEKGYKIIDRKEDASQKTLRVEAFVDKFWSWMNPGFWAITLSTEITTDLSIHSPKRGKSITVTVQASENYQTALDENWTEVINKALRAYVEELKARLE